MKTITLRLPAETHQRLVGLCRDYGLTMRGIFEATVIICRDDTENPDRREWTDLLWEAAQVLDADPAFRPKKRRRVNAKLDDDIADWFMARCQKAGVTYNAGFGLVATVPWPVPEPEGYREFRRENWQRIVELARQREFSRRPYALA